MKVITSSSSTICHWICSAICSSWPSTLSCDMPTLMQTMISETNSHSVCVSDVAAAIHEKGVITCHHDNGVECCRFSL